MKRLKSSVAIAILMALYVTPSMAVTHVSERCKDVILESAIHFAGIDAVNDGVRQEDLTEQQAHQYISDEVKLVNDIYDRGAKVYQFGYSRDEAEQIIDQSNLHVGPQPHNRQKVAEKAAKDAFMCGYDDQADVSK